MAGPAGHAWQAHITSCTCCCCCCCCCGYSSKITHVSSCIRQDIRSRRRHIVSLSGFLGWSLAAVVCRLTNSIMMHGRNNGKKLLAVSSSAGVHGGGVYQLMYQQQRSRRSSRNKAAAAAHDRVVTGTADNEVGVGSREANAGVRQQQQQQMLSTRQLTPATCCVALQQAKHQQSSDGSVRAAAGNREGLLQCSARKRTQQPYLTCNGSHDGRWLQVAGQALLDSSTRRQIPASDSGAGWHGQQLHTAAARAEARAHRCSRPSAAGGGCWP